MSEINISLSQRRFAKLPTERRIYMPTVKTLKSYAAVIGILTLVSLGRTAARVSSVKPVVELSLGGGAFLLLDSTQIPSELTPLVFGQASPPPPPPPPAAPPPPPPPPPPPAGQDTSSDVPSMPPSSLVILIGGFFMTAWILLTRPRKTDPKDE